MPSERGASAAAIRDRGGRASLGFAVVGGIWAAAHGLGILGPLENATFVLIGAATVVATVCGVRWYRPRVRWPWWLICGSLIVFLVGGAARAGAAHAGNLTATRSLVPDLITLPGYLILGSGTDAAWPGPVAGARPTTSTPSSTAWSPPSPP